MWQQLGFRAACKAKHETEVAQPVPIAKRIGRTGEVLMGIESAFKSIFDAGSSFKNGMLASRSSKKFDFLQFINPSRPVWEGFFRVRP